MTLRVCLKMLTRLTKLIGISQRVPSKPVSFALDQGRSLSSPRSSDGLLCHLPHLQHIHPIHMHSGHPECRTLLPNLRIRSSSQMGHTNCPQIIFDNKDDRQLPQLSHVQALKELSIVTSPIPEEGHGHMITALFLQDLPLVLGRERRAGGDRNPLTDESKSTDQIMLLREHVHGASLASAAARFLAEQLAHNLAGRHSLAERVDVVPIGADHGILLFQELDEARRDSFLPVVEMDEAEHLAPVVHLSAHVFERPPQNHVFVELQSLLLRDQQIGAGDRGLGLLLLDDIGCGDGGDGGGGGPGTAGGTRDGVEAEPGGGSEENRGGGGVAGVRGEGGPVVGEGGGADCVDGRREGSGGHGGDERRQGKEGRESKCGRIEFARNEVGEEGRF